MRTIFLNKTYKEALEAYGIELVSSQPKTNLLEKLSDNDRIVISLQTERLLGTIPFSNMGLTSALDDRPIHSSEPEDLVWDVFLKEGNITRAETLALLRELNCVTCIDGTLIFFEDEQVEGTLIERVIKAMGAYLKPGEVMALPAWQYYLKTC